VDVERRADTVKAILEGGQADGRECEVDARTKKIQVPVPGKGGFGAQIYNRTDRRRDGAVVYVTTASQRRRR